MPTINLTKEQQTIVDLNKGEHLVLAPPGTGKTELLTERLANAIKNGIKQEDMICLTFTNRAATNMLERVERKIGEQRIFIGNLHNWCNKYLNMEKIISQNMSLLDEEDSLLIIDELKEDLKIEYKIKDRGEIIKLNTFTKQKKLGFNDNLLLPPNLTQEAKKFEKELSIICDEYEKIKNDSLYIDFDDLLTLSYDHISKNIDNINIPWIQIDEIQDLNPLQWAIVEAITDKEQSHRVFFGDYGQAIFSFMGAKVDSLNKICQKGTKVHCLYENFRSPQYLLDLYNKYAKKWLNPDWEKSPQAHNKIIKEKYSLSLREIEGNDYNEANWIISTKLPREPQNTTAILVRTNKIADMYANLLNDRGLKYFKVSGFDLFKRKEVKDLLAFFNILIRNEDRKSWARVLWRYARIHTLKESRKIVNSMYLAGLRPLDFIDNYPYKLPMLDQFHKDLQYGRIVVFDTETTGLDTEKDDIIQIAAIEIIQGKVGKEFEVFINTDKDITASEKIHRITRLHLNENAIDRKEALKKFVEFVGNDVLIAHNIKYDKEILNSNLHREGLVHVSSLVRYFDSIALAQRLYPDFYSYKLEYLIKQLNIEGENTHNALDDVRATVNLLLSFNNKIKETIILRDYFIQKNDQYLDNFKNRFSPIYTAIVGEFSNDLPLDEIVSMVLDYMDNNFNYNIKEETYKELDKLTNHMKKKCVLDKVLNKIKRYIPEYMKSTEIDLVLCN